MIFQMRRALAFEHREILLVARQSPYTRDFSNQLVFSSEAAYQKGWVTLVRRTGEGVQVVGFTCIRVKSRAPEVTLYFLGVDQEHRRRGVARLMMQPLLVLCQLEKRTLTLNVAKENEAARLLYEQHGMRVVGEALAGKGWRMST